MILEARNLKKYFPIERGFLKTISGFVKAVDDVSFCLEEGETLGILGESGCGKTTLAKLILKLSEPTSGEVIFSPDIKLRRDVGIVFQNPFLSLNPKMSVKETLLEPLLIWRLSCDVDRVLQLLRLVGLNDNILKRLPSQLSGGERQRVCIARSLAAKPKLIILDEPLSSLDLISQKQILELLIKLKNEFNIAYIFISHNIAVVKKIANRVIVMLEGKVVEAGVSSQVFLHPQNGYTKKLLEAAN